MQSGFELNLMIGSRMTPHRGWSKDNRSLGKT